MQTLAHNVQSPPSRKLLAPGDRLRDRSRAREPNPTGYEAGVMIVRSPNTSGQPLPLERITGVRRNENDVRKKRRGARLQTLALNVQSQSPRPVTFPTRRRQEPRKSVCILGANGSIPEKIRRISCRNDEDSPSSFSERLGTSIPKPKITICLGTAAILGRFASGAVRRASPLLELCFAFLTVSPLSTRIFIKVRRFVSC